MGKRRRPTTLYLDEHIAPDLIAKARKEKLFVRKGNGYALKG